MYDNNTNNVREDDLIPVSLSQDMQGERTDMMEVEERSSSSEIVQTEAEITAEKATAAATFSTAATAFISPLDETNKEKTLEVPSTVNPTTTATSNHNNNNASNQIDTSWMTPEEKNEFSALCLRFSFQHKSISSVYFALKMAGWIFYPSERKYLPPDAAAAAAATATINQDDSVLHLPLSESLMYANEVAEHLDYYSLEEDLVSDLHIPTNQLPPQYASRKEIPRLIAQFEGQEERWRRLRDNVIYHFFVTDLKKQKQKEVGTNTEILTNNNGSKQSNVNNNNNNNNNNNSNEQLENDKQNPKAHSTMTATTNSNTITSTTTTNQTAKVFQRRNQPRRSAAVCNKDSVTTADVGADMFMKKGSIQARHNHNKHRKKSQTGSCKGTLSSSAASQASARGGNGGGGGGGDMATVNNEEEEQPSFERLSLEECQSILQDPKQLAHHGLEYQELTQDQILEVYRKDMEDWRFLLATNHSLLLYGYGSKLHLLNVFAEQGLSHEGYAVVLNGFDPDISVESILDLLVELFLDGLEPGPLQTSLPGMEDDDVVKWSALHMDPKTSNLQQVILHKICDPVERARAIATAIAKNQAKELFPIFLVIHNLEGMGLRNRLAQDILSTLVSHSIVQPSGLRGLRLIASVDHVDAAAVLWSVRASAQYRWMWKKVHTYEPYKEELIMLEPDELNTNSNKTRRASGVGSKRQQQASIIDGKGADRVMNVLRSVANRHTEVMQILATLQLAAPGGPNKLQWVDFAQLQQNCLNKCTVRNGSQLRTFLSELEDHELVAVQKQGLSKVMVRIPYSDDKLNEILAFERARS